MTGGGKCCAGCKIVGMLVGLGALNWGLVGLFRLDVVARLLGAMSGPARIVYVVIGLAGLLKLISCVRPCPACCGTKSDGGCSSSK